MKRGKIGIYRLRRIVAAVIAALGVLGLVITNPASYEEKYETTGAAESNDAGASAGAANEANASGDEKTEANGDTEALLATTVLERLEIKGRAPKTGYTRDEFYSTWPVVEGCNLRQRILRRELGGTAVLADDQCTVLSGEFDEPYTGQHLIFYEKADLSNGLQIDHVVALSDAWQKGAQNLTAERRYELATDPLNLLAVEAAANQKKSDGDAATWLPANKSFRCQYVARQISVKYKYGLWVTQAERDAMAGVLEACPNEPAVGVE